MKSVIASLLLCLAAASPSVAGDLTSELVALEKTGWTAWSKGDGQAFKDLISEDAVQAVAGGGITVGRDKIMADVASHGCEVKGFAFHDAKVRQLSPDIALLSYTATQDATCQGNKLPGKVYSTAVYVRKDGKWRSVNYQETPLD